MLAPTSTSPVSSNLAEELLAQVGMTSTDPPVDADRPRLGLKQLRDEGYVWGNAKHRFAKNHFSRPTYCNVCLEFIWGFTHSGYRCEVCRFAAHPACLAAVSKIAPCQPTTVCTVLGMKPLDPSWQVVPYLEDRSHERWWERTTCSDEHTVDPLEAKAGSKRTTHTRRKRSRLSSRRRAAASSRSKSTAPEPAEKMDLSVDHTACSTASSASSEEFPDEPTAWFFQRSTKKVDDSKYWLVPPPRDPFEMHHWVEGNLPSGCKCFECQDTIHAVGFGHYRCSRCREVVHSDCLLASSPRTAAPCRPVHYKLVFRGIHSLHHSATSDGASAAIATAASSREVASEPCSATISSSSSSSSLSSSSVSSSSSTSACVDISSTPLASDSEAAASFIDEEITPLLVFVNSKSGGQQGDSLMRKFQRLIGPCQVVDLNHAGPRPALEVFKHVPNFRVLACGGDGTVGWVLQELDKTGLDPIPPVGIVPLGTGNDLARTLGWGAGYSDESISEILSMVASSQPVCHDRWRVQLLPPLTGPDHWADLPRHYICNNYWSFGADAKVVLAFHELRQSMPSLCSTRLGNKLIYAIEGGKACFNSFPSINSLFDVDIDGVKFVIPDQIEGIIILTVPFYAGGFDLWGQDVEDVAPAGMKRKPFTKSSTSDGLLEVVGITGSFHMGTITAGLSKGIRIAQAADIRLRAKSDLEIPFQVDGEPERLALPAGGTIHCSKWLSGQMLFWHGGYPDRDREQRRHRHQMEAKSTEEEELFL
mmetsp:Transcript_11704/g.29577  ORF Transcript_11704/g.29577 Transcript_11704/m.29577 type:complete len:762 (-) Transcript_11704:45-2330(-)